MQPQPQSSDYAEAIAVLVGKMPLERAAQVYEFVRFLQNQPAYPPPIMPDGEDWLNDSEEQMQAEDALWDAAYARHQETFDALAVAARAEIEEGRTQPMFTDDGTLVEE